MRSGPAFSGALWIVACVAATRADAGPSTPGATTSPPVNDLSRLRSDAEALLSSRAESLWHRWISGEILAGVNAQADLGSAESVARVTAELRTATDPMERRRLQRLRSFLADEALGQADGAVSTEIADIVGGASLSLENREVAFRNLDLALESEADAAVRKNLWAATQQVLDRLNPLLLVRDSLREKTARSLGYARLLDFEAELREAELDSLSVQADEFLAATDDLNREKLGKLAPDAIGVPLAQATPSDFPRLLRTSALDKAFPTSNAMVQFRALARNLGMDLAGLTLDLEDRRGKVPVSLCLPVRPPEDVRCALSPHAGVAAAAALLREGAQGMRMTASRSAPFEFRWLGGTATAAAFGQLFERLTEDPHFLAESGVPAAEAEAFARARAARRLLAARVAAGRFLVEKARLGGLASDPAEAFRETLERAHGVPLTAFDGQRYLLETIDLLASADDFRAALLAAQLEATLVSRFSTTWWKNPPAGMFLRGLWANGTRDTPDELARELGARGLDSQAFVAATKR